MVSNKRWALSLQKNVVRKDDDAVKFRPFRKFATRQAARVEHMQWPTPTYIIDTLLNRIVR